MTVAASELLARALRLGQTASQASAPPDELAALYVQSPWRFGQGLGLELPKGITWLRANVTSDADGLVGIDVRAGVESAELAQTLVGELERILSILGERVSSAIDPSPLSKLSGKHKEAKNLVERSETRPTARASWDVWCSPRRARGTRRDHRNCTGSLTQRLSHV